MTVVLHKVYDDRGPLQKYMRQELLHLARRENREDIDPEMPGDLIRRKFSERPPSEWPRPVRGVLGKPGRFVVPPYDTWCKTAFGSVEPEAETTEVVETDPLSDLERQWMAAKTAETDFNSLPFWKLKQECKARGISFKRTDTKHALLEKLNGHKNAS